MSSKHVHVNRDVAVSLFTSADVNAPVTMLNLLRFRAVADYSDTPRLAPPSPISGREAYEKYMQHTEPFITELGGSLEAQWNAGPTLIGPTDEVWDLVLLVRHASLSVFRTFASHPGYLTGIGHRTAALADSRLLPLFPTPADS